MFCAASPTGQRFATSLIDKLANGAEELAQRGEIERARWLRMLALRCEMSAETRELESAGSPRTWRSRCSRLGIRKKPGNSPALGEEGCPAGTESRRLGRGSRGRGPLPASDRQPGARCRHRRFCNFAAPAVLEELAQARHPLILPAVLAAAQET